MATLCDDPYRFTRYIIGTLGLGQGVKRIIIDIQKDSAVMVYVQKHLLETEEDGVIAALSRLSAEHVVVQEVTGIQVDERGNVVAEYTAGQHESK